MDSNPIEASVSEGTWRGGPLSSITYRSSRALQTGKHWAAPSDGVLYRFGKETLGLRGTPEF
jgi:hypothetical protein